MKLKIAPRHREVMGVYGEERFLNTIYGELTVYKINWGSSYEWHV